MKSFRGSLASLPLVVFQTLKCTHLMHTYVALVTKHHLVAVLSIRRLTDVTHHVLIILDPKPLLRFHCVAHVVIAMALKLLHESLHGVLIQQLHA